MAGSITPSLRQAELAGSSSIDLCQTSRFYTSVLYSTVYVRVQFQEEVTRGGMATFTL